MNLVLYSGGQQKTNHRLHQAVVRLARKRNPNRSHKLKMTYIPFCSDSSEVFFHRIMRRYRAHGVERFFCLNVDRPVHPAEIAEALSSDIIYLAGGNTFYFLKHLRSTGMLSKLRTFVKKGGVLAGLSAGGLIMSPTTKSAAEESLGPDENEVNLKNFKSMGLFSFEFSPHFTPTRKQIAAHLAYSKKTKYPVIATPDGGGIIIEGKTIQFVKPQMIFYRGKTVDHLSASTLLKMPK